MTIYLSTEPGMKIGGTLKYGDKMLVCDRLYSQGKDMKRDKPEYAMSAQNGYWGFSVQQETQTGDVNNG
jgi:hypothetical protein